MHHGHVHAHHHVQGGAPVIDIGDDIGALVVFMDDVDEGTELFLRAEGEPASTVHTGVWTRQHRGGHVTAAVFGELAEGSYWVLDAVGSDRFLVQIRGGELAQIDVRTGARTPA
jgi:hypothetical protein